MKRLRRELLKEMGIEIEPYADLSVIERDYGTVTIRLITYKAMYASGEIAPTDHDEDLWDLFLR
ncbi:NUDIX hydrolase [Paenibacillus arenilitoris]|uniref:Uncharacterized protein n=1 Tax=Paenibacillus arenilitoris TaxID=2772299 RepID=A0A927H9S3_9BACL|nr:hypothetical protein [Paenibacillus arenilitoris]MBD2871909.1 hypothetical protein [Paenibacillus arenilitoris]